MFRYIPVMAARVNSLILPLHLSSASLLKRDSSSKSGIFGLEAAENAAARGTKAFPELFPSRRSMYRQTCRSRYIYTDTTSVV